MQWIDFDKLELSRHKPNKAPPAPSADALAIASSAGIDALGTILAEPSPRGPETYEILRGLIIWRAAQVLQIPQVPVDINTHIDEQTAQLLVHLDYGLHNDDAVAVGRKIQQLVKTGRAKTKTDAGRLQGVSRFQASRLVRLQYLPLTVRNMLADKRLKASHARTLLPLSMGEQLDFAFLVVENNWSVRQLEEAIRNHRTGNASGTTAPAGAPRRDPNIVRLEQRITRRYGTTAAIEHDPATRKGRLILEYGSLDQLDGILELMRVPED
ncbi:MAG: hypothetical protein CVV05_00750 [Gammaproteobacteria bacterium HGW-Gammaproteobacteria-1]|jgi:ParB family chromosome partitioning protein|nr:MAG: hypothetical protein CVV05_00750 [Gammaproteobacteria bacterium HGW-Gammaproteobacteria-1]